MKIKNVAGVLAAGSGTRFGSHIPKQFSVFNNKILIEYSLEVFQNHPCIDEIIVAVPEGYINLLEEIKVGGNYSKITKIVTGGKERYHSSMAVINTFPSHEEVNLLLHDAARPFVSSEIISRIIETLQNHRAVIAGIPATDTIIELDNYQNITRIPERKTVFHVQTPQAFKLSVLRKAFEKALNDSDFVPTDDGSVVFRYLPEEKIAVIPGDEKNRKITFPEDLNLL